LGVRRFYVREEVNDFMNKIGLIHHKRALHLIAALVAGISLTAAFSLVAKAQDQDQDQNDPPSRVARLGHIDGSVSFQPAGESDWVEATRNRPMTTGDKLWADRDSRAEVQLGSSKIDLAANTGFTFLNLDDRTVQIQLSAGTVNVRVYELDRDTDYEIDTANQAFVIQQPGRYRVESSENGDYTIVTIRDGEGESTGNGQSYTIHRGQRVTFRGTTSLNAEVDQIGDPDPFDRWSDDRERRYEDSPSARYCSRQVVGFEDLDESGDWSPRPSTEASGIRAWTRVGLRTTTGIGPGLIPGDGLGSTMRAGATHLSITGVGFSSAAAGVGYPGRAKFVPCTRQLSSLSSVELGSESAVTSRGFHSGRGKCTCRHTV
jgi:hypothetical protein